MLPIELNIGVELETTFLVLGELKIGSGVEE